MVPVGRAPYADSGVTAAVQFGQRRAATEISEVHSGQARFAGEIPRAFW
jgi:hypothetical protein